MAAFDLTKSDHPKLWRTGVEGFKADHADHLARRKAARGLGHHASVADVFDAATGEIVGNFPTGYYPHQNDYSADGKHIYNSSIGNVGYGAVTYARQRQEGRPLAGQGRRARRWKWCAPGSSTTASDRA